MDPGIVAAMHRCLELAERGRGGVGVNPLVGAVLVRQGAVMAEGWHERFGGPHAERKLLEEWRGGIEPEDVLVVNLEPCCHRQKKTPPCTDLLVASGIRHIVIGMTDPNPAVAGRGIAALRSAGISVTVGMERARCEWLNRGYVSLQRSGRPWITLKEARTRDGRHARGDGSSLKITDAAQDQWSHTWLRSRHDAILVGRGTVQRDDPQLTVRHVPSTKCDQFQPLRIVLDPHLTLPLDARVAMGDLAAGTIVVGALQAQHSRAAALASRGMRVLRVPMHGPCFDWAGLWGALTVPAEGFSGITSVLVEGGPTTWTRFRQAGMVDAEVTLLGDPPTPC